MERELNGDVPNLRLVLNWLQGGAFIFCGGLKEKDEDLLVKPGT